jgi:hypothetical protein
MSFDHLLPYARYPLVYAPMSMPTPTTTGDPHPALQAAQKRAPEADPMFQLARDRQLCARPKRTTAIIPRANQ